MENSIANEKLIKLQYQKPQYCEKSIYEKVGYIHVVFFCAVVFLIY